jgi:hypothetical protein
MVAVALALTPGAQVSTQSGGREWYVSPSGSATGTGSISSPMSLTKALSSASPAQPGDTIWLRGGTYTGVFTSVLTGTASAPITVRGYRGERATLDANSSAARSAGQLLTINGAHTIFRDFEVTSSDASRTDQNTGYGNFPIGVTIAQSQNIKLVNLVIHDLVGQGIGAWSENTTAEIYGCLVYNNGMSDHDHGVYVQNQTGRKRIADNIIFNQASHGIHGYASSDAYLDNITIEGNTVFENGALLNQSSRNILLGGGRVAQNGIVRSNYTYLRSTMSNSNIGYSAGASNAVVQDNYWIAGNAAMNFKLNGGETVTGNLFIGPVSPSDAASRWPSNTYRSTRPTSGQAVFVRRNEYEPGRANITIYNWAKAASVAIDLSAAGLAVGDSFEVRDVLDFYGGPVVTGTYSGTPVNVPMSGLTVAPPVGASLRTPTHTAPEFGAFVLLRTSTGSGGGNTVGDTTAPVVSLTAPMPGLSVSGMSTVSASASDNVGVTGVQFKIDGADLGQELAMPPYSLQWDTSTASNGSHTITAVARDAAGNMTTSAPVAFFVNNTTQNNAPVVSITAPGQGQALTGTTTVSASASDDGGVAGVQFKIDGVNLGAEDTTAPYSVSWTTTNVANGTHQVTAVARDSAGLRTTSAAVSVSVNNTTSTTPVVSVASPTSGQSVSGVATVTATASDPGGVAGVQFQADGVNIGPEDTTAPYSASWDTTRVTGGSHTVTAIARNSAGRRNTSAPVVVSVTNAPATPSNFRIIAEAESGSLQRPLAKRKDSRASGRFYVATDTPNRGKVSFTIDIPADGRYVVWARVLARSDSQDSFTVLADGSSPDIYDVAEGTWSDRWQWTPVNGRASGAPATLNPRLFTLSRGRHTLTFEGREANTGLDQLIVTNDVTFVPRD